LAKGETQTFRLWVNARWQRSDFCTEIGCSHMADERFGLCTAKTKGPVTLVYFSYMHQVDKFIRL